MRTRGQARQGRVRIERRAFGGLIDRPAAQCGEPGADARQLGRLVAHRRAGGALRGRAVEPLRRDVGRVGLEHQRGRRQLAREAADAQRALEGQRAAEAEPEAEPDEHRRLLLRCR